jgi:predicted acetyltransferase
MPIEIRPAAPEEMEAYRRVALASLVLSPEQAPPNAIQAIVPELTLCAFMDGRLATSYAAWPLKMRLNGQVAPTAGITFVGTLPQYRQTGCLRQVITRHFERLHAAGEQPLAALIASQAAIYQRYGYAVVSTRNVYRIEPRHLQFAPLADSCRPTGTLRELGENETDLLKQIYRDFCAQRTGYLHRGQTTWAAGPLSPPPRNGFLFKMVYEEKGVPLGYMIYSLAPQPAGDGEPWQRVTVRDFSWLTPQAYIALWRHLQAMALASHVEWPRVPVDDPLPHLLLEPRRLNLTAKDGLLARVVDVQRVLPLRGYDTEGAITFELLDTLCPWNAGRFRLEASPQGAQVQPTTQTAQAVLPVETLAMLLFGQISATQAVRMGRMTLAEDKDLPLWDKLFSTRHKPFCPDFF